MTVAPYSLSNLLIFTRDVMVPKPESVPEPDLHHFSKLTDPIPVTVVVIESIPVGSSS